MESYAYKRKDGTDFNPLTNPVNMPFGAMPEMIDYVLGSRGRGQGSGLGPVGASGLRSVECTLIYTRTY